MRTLGEGLRTLRVERGYSLGEVALGTGLSSSFLSLVENGRSDISTGRLHRLARFLGVGLGALLDMSTLQDVTIVRAGERRAADGADDGLRSFPMVDGRDGMAMMPVVSELEVGAHTTTLPGRKGAERFALVMSGEIEIALAQGGVHSLETGDGGYFRSPVSHVRNAGDERAVVLFVACAPGPARLTRPDN